MSNTIEALHIPSGWVAIDPSKLKDYKKYAWKTADQLNSKGMYLMYFKGTNNLYIVVDVHVLPFTVYGNENMFLGPLPEYKE